MLVGLPGAGKTAVGALVAACLGLPFLDFDEEIVRREGMSIAELFAARGEPHFRGLERALTEEACAWPRTVLAPGGGWIAQAGLVALLRPPAVLVHLRVRPATALTRLRASPIARPLLAGPDPSAQIGALSRQRTPLYESADVAVDTEGLTPQAVASLVVSRLRQAP